MARHRKMLTRSQKKSQIYSIGTPKIFITAAEISDQTLYSVPKIESSKKIVSNLSRLKTISPNLKKVLAQKIWPVTEKSGQALKNLVGAKKFWRSHYISKNVVAYWKKLARLSTVEMTWWKFLTSLEKSDQIPLWASQKKLPDFETASR